MAVVLGPNRYGKAETRVVRIGRDGDTHDIKDLNVSVALAGDLAQTHLTGDNAKVLPTDTQKNTVYAFARRYGIGEIEDFGLLLGRHFVEQPSIGTARITIEEYGWQRLGPHSFQRGEGEIRSATVVVADESTEVVSGLTGLVLLNSTDSEFTGYITDEYTTLAETTDRVLATAVAAEWRHAVLDGDWAGSFAAVRAALVEAFVASYSRSLQQTLYEMGSAVLATRPEIAEIRLRLPNKHHFVVDLTPFGLDNPNEVFHADDRPYGLIEGSVTRDDAPPPGPAWGTP